MWNKSLAVALIVAATVFTGVDMAQLYPRLPARMASHFDVQGVPNGWSTKEEFAWMCGGTFVGMALFLCAVTVLMRFIPASLINLPDKDYWLGPEQSRATRRFITTWFLWFEALVLWLLAIVFHAVMNANLQQQPRLIPMWWLLGGFLAAVVVMLLAIVRRFPRTGEPAMREHCSPATEDGLQTRDRRE